MVQMSGKKFVTGFAIVIVVLAIMFGISMRQSFNTRPQNQSVEGVKK